MSKEGIPTIFAVLLLVLAVAIPGVLVNQIVLLIIGGVFFLLLPLVLYFFRDPQRTPPQRDDVIVSPADGKVMAVETVKEPVFFESKAVRVSIFLSLFDVHVNYVPFAGTVELVEYNRGGYLPAFKPEAGQRNANSFTGLETRIGKVAFKQSTGMVARRIVNHLRLGDRVNTGQKFGIIKFGSRMDVFLPETVNISVKPGDRVKAGEDVIATL